MGAEGARGREGEGAVAGGAPGDGVAVLEWFGTAEAAAVADRRLRRCGFPVGADLVGDVLSEARVWVLRRMRSPGPMVVENPAAYATTVVQRVIQRLSRGDVLRIDDLDDLPASEGLEADVVAALEGSGLGGAADELRVLLECQAAEPWLTAAALAHVCFLMHPDTVPVGAPSPRAGARPDQALAWPSLWFAGQRDLFPCDGADRRKRTRARRIVQVLEHLERIFARCSEAQECHRG